MEKLLELEKKLREYREELEKAIEVAPEGSNNRESYEKEFKKKEKKHEDEKEDKKMIAEALDVHNEKKHGEAKDKDSALKDAGLKKSIDEKLDDLLEKAQMSSKVMPQRKNTKVTPPSTTIPSKPKVIEAPKPGTTEKPMPIGEKNGISVAHVGYNRKGSPMSDSHDFDIHRDGKKIGEHSASHDGDSGTRMSHAEGASDEHKEKVESHVHKLVSEHMKKYPENYKEPMKKGLGSKLDNAESKERVKHALGSIRPSAKVTDSEGNVSEVSPAKQVSDKVAAVSQKKDAAKMKAESEAAARRASYKKQGLMKNNQQWELE